MDVAIKQHWSVRALDRRWRDGMIVAVALGFCAFFLFFDLRTPPIILWDESRTAVNALEMRHTGLGLVTTYGFQPDLWNTKPPLLIWLMTGSMAVFGTGEWAMRLPSAVAALATLLIVILFTRRVTGSLGTAILAACFLTLSPGFFGEHGARTADYDALLLLFVTAYGQLLFFAIHRRQPRRGLLVSAGLLIAGAVLTKSSAGLAPGVGIAAYILLSGRWRRLVEGPNYIWMATAAIAPPLLFCIAREYQAPGYLDAALFNDAAGRFNQSLVRERPFWFYAGSLLEGAFAATWLLVLLPLVHAHLNGKSRALVSYSLIVTLPFLLLITLTSTRLIHYALPIFPFLAIAAAIIFRAAIAHLIRPNGVRPLTRMLVLAFCVLTCAQMVVGAAEARYRLFPARQFYAQASYGDLFANLSRQGVSHVTVADNGFVLEQWPHYTPLLAAYRLIWQEKGLVIEQQTKLDIAEAEDVIASCDPLRVRQIAKLGEDISGTPGCTAVHLMPR